jgi:hypothetical protein
MHRCITDKASLHYELAWESARINMHSLVFLLSWCFAASPIDSQVERKIGTGAEVGGLGWSSAGNTRPSVPGGPSNLLS